jgi:hypothetical protein
LYQISIKTWSEVKINNNYTFESRLCHTCSVYGTKLFVFGGMKNSDVTLDTLSILCLDGNFQEFEENKTLEIGPPVTSNYKLFY